MAESTRIAAGAVAGVPPGARKLVFVPGGETVLLFNLDGQFYALENSCPHAGASLAGGACEAQVLTCPAHGLKFHIRTGECTASPQMRIPVYGVHVEDGQLWLQLPEPSQARGAA